MDMHRFNPNRYHGGRKVLLIIGLVLLGVAAVSGLAYFVGWVIMLLWNWLMPDIFGLKTISLWQALGLFILAKLLFSVMADNGDKNHPKSHHHKKVREHHRRVSEPNKVDTPVTATTKEPDDQWTRYWEEGGKAAFEAWLRKRETDPQE